MTEQNFTAMRRAMVESQLRTNDVNDPAIIQAVLTVPRETFVPTDRRDAAYIDRAVPLGDGRALNPPLATARLIAAVSPQKGDKVLLIGAATGYAAALLAMLGAQVVAIEEDDALLATARAALAGQDGVTLVQAPLTNGHAADGPYDIVLIDGAVESFPEALVAQLRIGGQAAFGRRDEAVTRLCSGSRSAGGFGAIPFLDCEAVHLPGFAQPKSFSF